MTIIASDTFVGRTVTGGFGTASDGESWNPSSGVSGVGVSGGYGYDTGGGYHRQYLGTQTLADSLQEVKIVFNGTSDLMRIQSRWNESTTTWYFAEVHTNVIYLEKFVNGTQSTFASATLSLTVGTLYDLKFLTQGTTIAAKIWQDGTQEPTSYTVSGTDSSISAAGNFGLMLNGASSIGMQCTNYTVDNLVVPPSTGISDLHRWVHHSIYKLR
jgi:hypothetical protein